MVKILSWFILTYKKLLSPVLGQHCRFYPSCSTYCLQAINSHGALKGSWLGLKRICRCHPMSAGGVDMVPTNCNSTTTLSDNKDHVANGY